jgi:tetratricopeptide (TPR) repeat protein
MDKVKFQEQMQIAIAMWTLETCYSICRRAIAAGKTIDEINEWTKELFYFVDERDFEWAYKNLKGPPEGRKRLTEVRNFFQSLKEIGFKYGEDFTMMPSQGLVVSDKLRATVDKFIKIGYQFNTISNYQQENLMFGKTLDFLLPLPHDSSTINYSGKTTNLNEAEAETYLKQGYAYITNGNVRAAFESYNKAISISPDWADAYYGRGYAQYDLGHYQEAIEDYSQAIHINPNFADALQNRALTRSVIGDIQGAVKDAEKAAEIYLKQNNLDSYNQAKSFVVRTLALKSVKGESLNMGAQLQSEAEQLYNTGNTLAMSGHYQEALKSYDQAIALNKSNPMYFNNRASTLKRLGRMQDALTQYHELIKLRPSYGKAHLSMASTYVELNVYSGAVNSYKRFLLAYKSGLFSFNSIVGGKNQIVQGKSELETILFSSINYLLPEQQERAIEAFNEAISQSDEFNSTSQSDGFNSTLLNKVLKRINSKIFGYQRGKNYNDMISYLESGNVHMTKEYFKLMAAYVEFNNPQPDDTLAVVVEFWYKSLGLFKKTNNLLYLELSKHFLERLSRFIKGTSRSMLFINFPIFEDLTEEEQLSFLNYLENYKYS